MTFSLVGTAELRNLNVRKEHHGEEKILALDLEFATIVPSTAFDYFDPELRNTLWINGAPRFAWIKPLEFDAEILDVNATINASIVIPHGNVSKFRVQPLNTDKANLRFRLSYRPNDHSHFARLTDLIETQTTIDIGGQPELPFDEPAAPKDEDL